MFPNVHAGVYVPYIPPLQVCAISDKEGAKRNGENVKKDKKGQERYLLESWPKFRFSFMSRKINLMWNDLKICENTAMAIDKKNYPNFPIGRNIEELHWFETTQEFQLFCWEFKGWKDPSCRDFKLGGNRKAYQKISKELLKTLPFKDQGIPERHLTFPLSIPQEVPPALPWLDTPPPLAKQLTVRMEHLLAYFKKAFPRYRGIHWFKELKINVMNKPTRQVDLIEETIVLNLAWKDVKQCALKFAHDSFPGSSSYLGSDDEDDELDEGHRLRIASDWFDSD